MIEISCSPKKAYKDGITMTSWITWVAIGVMIAVLLYAIFSVFLKKPTGLYIAAIFHFNVSLGLTLLKQMRENGKMGVQSVPCDLFQNGGKKMRKIGYVRVSSVEQNPARQYHQLEEIGMD